MTKLTQAERNAALSLKRKAAAARRKKLLASAERRLKAQREANRKWRAANPAKVAAQQARYYAKRLGQMAQIAPEPNLPPVETNLPEPANEPAISMAPATPFDPAAVYGEAFLAKFREQNADEGAPKPPDVVDNG